MRPRNELEGATRSRKPTRAPIRSIAARPLLALLACLALAACEPNLPMPADPTPLDELVIDQLEGDQVPGLQAAVLRDGAVVETHAWGWADTETRRLVDDDTIFTIASVSKLIAAVAIMQQVEAGTLSLDAPLDVGFEVAHPETGSTITLRQLLTHTSSVVDNWDEMDPLYTEERQVTLRQFMEGYFTPGGTYFHSNKNWASRAPGTRYEYSNIGLSLAALALEVATGQDFAEYTEEAIFAPLGMDATGWFLEGVDRSHLAMPTKWKRGWKPAGHFEFPDYPAGSLRTSATELGRFLLAATDPSMGLLGARTIDEMLRIQDPELNDTQALGFFFWTLGGERAVGHDGGDVGMSSEVLLRPDHGDGVVLLSNGELSASIFRRIERAILEG